MTLTGDRWRRAQELFDTAVDLPTAARDRYLSDACGGDRELRAVVDRLLTADAAAGEEFLDEESRDRVFDFAATAPREGLRIGPYRIVRELGRGGMGAVYLAERVDDVYAGRVAIKFVHGSYPDADLRRRFRSERQILADLRHPGIPPLLDGGTTEDGTPYLVMEYVEGEAITDHARRVRLPVRDRLRLFLDVCDAVAHAHRSLIVHRDIKPSNVLVDRDGRIRLVDFGVAKPLGPDRTAEATAVFRRLTPAHAAPEQLRAERITVATDVHALGLLLYELLTGVQPFITGTTVATQHRVLHEDPPAPSTITPHEDLPAIPRQLAPGLDAIVAEAMRKDPAERFPSVERMANEVRRALGGTGAHRWSRVLAGVAAGSLLAVLAGSLWLARLAEDRDLERTARAQADQRAAFLAAALGPAAGSGTVLDSIATDHARADAPWSTTRAGDLVALASALTAAGRTDAAAELLDVALRGAETTDGGVDGPTTADVLDAVAGLHLVTGQRAAGQSAALRALAVRERARDPLARARTLTLVADYRADRDPAAAHALLDRAYDLDRAGTDQTLATRLVELYDRVAEGLRMAGQVENAAHASARAEEIRARAVR